MEILVAWVILSVAVCAWANSLDRSAFGWLVVALVLSPLLAAIFLAIAGRNGKTCPKCAETVKRDALVCKHCSHPFPAPEPPAPATAPAAVPAEGQRPWWSAKRPTSIGPQP